MRAARLAIPLIGVLALGTGTWAKGAADAIATMRLVDIDGRAWTADSLRGRVTLIDFWATWCAPCLTELPYLKQARSRYSTDEFEILGVSFDVSDRRTLMSWLNRQGVMWPQVFDGRGRNGPAARHFAVIGVPTSFLIGGDGSIAATNLRGQRLLTAIDTQVRALRAARSLQRAASTPPESQS
jgi:thiol-disulfide isomerase/thioredoxin